MYPTKKLPEILTKDDFSIGKIKTQDYLLLGDFAVVDQGKNLIGGYSNEKSLVYTGRLPVIVYGDHTNVVKHINFPFIGGADGIKVFSFQKDVDTKYAFYLLEHFKPETQGYRRHYSLLKDVDLPLPPLSTQSKIVAKLDEAFGNIDSQISLLKANIEDVERVRKSAMEESFQSGEYEVKKLGSLATFLSGGTPSKSNKLFWIGDIPWISPKDMKRAKIDSATDYVSQLAIDSSATRILPPNSLLCVTRSGILIHSFPVAINTVPVSFNQDIRAIVPSKGLNSEYLFYALKAKERDILSNGVKKGPTVHSIISGYLDKLEIPLPSLPRQHEIVEHLDRVFTQTAAMRSSYEAQIRDLETLRQSLLEEAFAGRLVSE